MPDQWSANNGPHGGLQLVSNANALKQQLLKEAKSELISDLKARETNPNAAPRHAPRRENAYITTTTSYGNNWKPSTSSRHRRQSQILTPTPAPNPSKQPKTRPATSCDIVNDRLVNYPWATPECDPPPKGVRPSPDYKKVSRPPWVLEPGSKEKFADMIGCPGGFGPRPVRAVRRSKKKNRPAPFFIEQQARQHRHQMSSSIAQQTPLLDQGCGPASTTLGTIEQTRAANLRERGGQQWAEYLSPTNPLTQERCADSYNNALPDRSIARLVSRMSLPADADMKLRRNLSSREKMPRRPVRDSPTRGWCSIGHGAFHCYSPQEQRDCKGLATIQLRRGGTPVRTADQCMEEG